MEPTEVKLPHVPRTAWLDNHITFRGGNNHSAYIHTCGGLSQVEPTAVSLTRFEYGGNGFSLHHHITLVHVPRRKQPQCMHMYPHVKLCLKVCTTGLNKQAKK